MQIDQFILVIKRKNLIDITASSHSVTNKWGTRNQTKKSLMPKETNNLSPASRPLKRKHLTLALLAIGLPHHVMATDAQTTITAKNAASSGSSKRFHNKVTQLSGVTVNANNASNSYRADMAEAGTFNAQPIHETAASVLQVTRALLDDQQSRLLSEVVRNDASVQPDVAATGYYEGMAIRGFPLDPATGYQINGLTVAGQQNVALENKEGVDILKGLAAFQNGVGSPGGLINYETKRPANVHTLTVGTDNKGSRYYAGDIGWLNDSKDFGLRLNFAHEDIHSPIEHANGHRNFISLATDWKITSKASFQFDAEYQLRSQRSVNGYQLLGGTRVPDYASKTAFIGYEPWVKPTTIDAYNLSARFNYQLSDDWRFSLRAGRSWAGLDDNMSYAYGCYYVSSCSSSGDQARYFSAKGDYDIYDFRLPTENYRNDEVQALLFGDADTGALHHSLTFGLTSFQHLVEESEEVYDYVGSGNIYGGDIYYAPSPNTAGPAREVLDSRQLAAYASDQISFGSHWKLSVGLREVLLREKAFDNDTGAVDRYTRMNKLLPQTSLIYEPNSTWMFYASYSKGLALGDQAPWWATNADQFFAPYITRQLELGTKFDPSEALSLNIALFRMSKPYTYPKADDSEESYTYIQQGKETHVGLEMAASGQIGENFHYTSSVTFIRATADNTGSIGYDGAQALNQPHVRASFYGSYTLPFARSLSLLAGVNYSGRKAVLRDDSLQVPAFAVVNLGASYQVHLGSHPTIFRLSVDNVFNRFYWADVGSSSGDDFLYPGLPRTARLSVQYAF